jgi:hypothetical protein
MRSALVWFPVVGSAAAMVVILVSPPPSDGAGEWEPADVVGWADPAGARLSRDLDAARRGVAERTLDKSDVALGVARGELTLEQAAERFRQMNAARPDRLAFLRPSYPGASDDELVYRQVILFVRGNYRLDPARVAACLPGLEAEVSRRFQRSRAADVITFPVGGSADPGAPTAAAPVAAQAAIVR